MCGCANWAAADRTMGTGDRQWTWCTWPYMIDMRSGLGRAGPVGVESDRDCHDLPLPSPGCCVGSMSNGQECIGKAYPRGRPAPSYRRAQPTSPSLAQSLEQDTIPESYKPPPKASWLPTPARPAGSAKSRDFSLLRPRFCPDDPIEDTEGSPRPALANDQASRRTLPLGCASPAAGVSKLLAGRRTQRIWTPKWAKTPIRLAILEGGTTGFHGIA